MQRRKASNNLVLYIAIPLTLVFVLGVIGVIALIVSSDDKGEKAASKSKPKNRLVGKWTLDLDEVVRRQGLTGAAAEQTKQLLEASMKMEFTFDNDGKMTMYAKIPDEGTERASGKYEIKNIKGDTLDLHLDVKGQLFGEKLPIRFLSKTRFEGDFGGEMLVFKKI